MLLMAMRTRSRIKYPTLVPSTGERKKTLSKDSSVGNAVREEMEQKDDVRVLAALSPNICPPCHDGYPPRHTASDKGLHLKQADAARERAKWFVLEQSIRTVVRRER